jgi:protein-disulfide isomerase
MRRYLPFAIISAVLLIALGTGLALFRWKKPRSASTAPLVPIVSVTPAPTVASASSIAPSATDVPAAPVAPTVPVAQERPGQTDAGLPHFRGGANAPVTIEEFGDFQCIPCGNLFPKLKQTEADYGERLRLVFRHKPMFKHEHAVLAASAAEAAGLQGRFWEMHDLLFENSARWTKGVDKIGPETSPSRRLQSPLLAMPVEVRDVFLRYAEILKLDVERFKTDMDSDEVKIRIGADQARADTLAIDRTPTLYINGQLLSGNSHRSVETLHAAIDAVLSGKKPPEEAASLATATPGEPK